MSFYFYYYFQFKNLWILYYNLFTINKQLSIAYKVPYYYYSIYPCLYLKIFGFSIIGLIYGYL